MLRFLAIVLAAVTLAIFAVPEIVDLLRRGQAIAEQPPLGGGWIQGLRDAVWRPKGEGRLYGITILLTPLDHRGRKSSAAQERKRKSR